MLLPSCAFVLRNVHLCQSFPRQSHTSAHTSSHQWLTGRRAGSCYWPQCNLSDAAVSSCCSAPCSILFVGSLLQDELYCLNALFGTPVTHSGTKPKHTTSYKLTKDLDQCVQCVFFNDWMLWLKNNCASVFCRKLFCCFPVTIYIYIYIVCIFCNFVTWCILYFLCYNWYFVLCFVWLVKDALT